MTVREQETLLRALDLWRVAVGQMTWEGRAEASLALLIVRDDELEALRGRIERGDRLHIAAIDFPEFYAGALGGTEQSHKFFAALESAAAEPRALAKQILHQAARMLWLSDRMDEVAAGRPGLRILFFLIAAEAVAKLAFRFSGDGQSRLHVQRFFQELCSDGHRARLGTAFSFAGLPGPGLGAEEAVSYLYDVRCDVVHEGMYFAASLLRTPRATPVLNLWKGSPIAAHITAEELRQMVLEGTVLAAQRVVKEVSA